MFLLERAKVISSLEDNTGNWRTTALEKANIFADVSEKQIHFNNEVEINFEAIGALTVVLTASDLLLFGWLCDASVLLNGRT